MSRHFFNTVVALAALTQAQTTIVVSDSSTQTNPIEVSSRPTDDVPNLSDATTTIDTNTIPTIITTSLPIIPISSVSNHINGNNTYTMPTTAVVTPSGSCVTVTMQGEPLFTIQTDTILESPCTYTVFAGASGSVSSEVLITSSTTGSSSGESAPATGTTTPAADSSSTGTTSGTSAPATQSGTANRVTMGAEGLGLVAFIGALGLL